MKKKQLSTHRQADSPKQKKQQIESSEKNMHDLIGLLTEKVDLMQSMIDDFHLSPSSQEKVNDEESVNKTLAPTDKSSAPSFLDNNIIPEDINVNDVRFEPINNADTAPSEANELDGRLINVLPIQNSGAANSGQSAAAIAHHTSYNYAPPPTQTYCYGFTNSEFFAFIGNLDPVEYILVITVIAIIIGVELNVFERQIVGGALVDIGVTLGNMVEQELFKQARSNEVANRQRNEAEQNDFDTLYDSVDRLQAQIDALREQMGQNQT